MKEFVLKGTVFSDVWSPNCVVIGSGIVILGWDKHTLVGKV